MKKLQKFTTAESEHGSPQQARGGKQQAKLIRISLINSNIPRH